MGVHSTQGSVVVHRIRNGKAGRDAGSYYLTVSPTEFSLDSDGKVKGDGKVKVQAWLSVAAGTPAKAADSDIYLVVKAFKTDGTEATLLAKQQAAYEFDVKNYSAYRTFVVTLYDGTAKTNQWDSVTVIVGAQDAKDSIRVDLENENDSMLYQGDGTTKVNGDDQFLTSMAHLYDGYTKDPSGVVWSIDSKTDGCDATISTAGLVRVNSVTALVNVIKVKAVYKGGSYYAEMTVKKLVGVDKYELWLSVVSVGYNTSTKQATATSVTIRVYKTAQNGTRSNISTLPTGMTVSGSSTLSRAYSGGYATMPVDTSKSENYVVLKQGTQELDRETIPVLSFVNGQNVIRLDLDNENDSILYQGDGTTMIGEKPTSKWYLYDGITDVSSQVSLSDIVIESNSTGVTSSFTNTTDKRTIRIDGITSASGGSGEVILKVKYKDEYYRARMTVKRLVGIDKYELEVSPNSVGFNTTTNTSTGSTVTVRVWKTAQNGTRSNIATLPSGYKLLINGTDYASSYSSKKYSFTAASDVNNYVIVLTDGTNDLDTETVPVLSVKDGGKGDPGNPGQPGANGVSYILDVQKAQINFASDGKVRESEIYGYAYKYEAGTYTGVNLTDSNNNWVQLRYNNSNTSKITYTAEEDGHWDDDDDNDGNLAGVKLTSQTIYIELYVAKKRVAQQIIMLQLPGADGYNYLPINNGPYQSNKEYVWNIEKRDFVDIEEEGEWNRYGVKSFGMTVPANTPPPNSSYWTKIQQKISTLIANTVFGTNANIGGFLVSANRFLSSMVAYYVRYKGTYNASTTYYYDTEEMNAPRIDLVLYNENYYVPRAPGSLVGTVPTNTLYWRSATAEEIRASENAVGTTITMYKIELNGIDGIIRVLHADGYRWEVQKDGIQLLGNDAGRHIELDPINREIRLYNDDGELSVRMDGVSETGVANVFGTDQNRTFSMSYTSGERSVTGSASGWTNRNYSLVLGTLKTESAGRVRIRGTMKAYATYTYYGETLNNPSGEPLRPIEYDRMPQRVYEYSSGYYYIDRISANLYIYTYDSQSKNRLLGKKYVGFAAAYGGNKWTEYTVTGDVVVDAGYHELVLEYYVSLSANNYACGKVNWSLNSYSFTADFYQSRIFANGLAFGSSGNNALVVVRNSNGEMEMRYATSNAKYGFEMLPGQVSDILETKLLRRTVMLGYGFCDCYKQANGTQTAYVRYSQNAVRGGGYFSVTRMAEGKWKITFPSEWSALGITATNITAKVTPKSVGDYVRMASIVEITATSMTVHTGDDDSPNDEIGFWFQIEYMLP